jgi:carboxyl-terminal processing protease
MVRQIQIFVSVAFVICVGSPLSAVEPELLEETSRQRASELKAGRWIDVIEREIPLLENDPGDRMPMIMWHGVGFQPLSPREIEVLHARGLCQHLQLAESMIPAAKALQQAGMPVILMEGRTDSWPYSLGKDWMHQFDASFPQPWFGKEDASQWHGACPHRIDGWKVLATKTKQRLQKFQEAGVRVDAVLVDYEGDPYPWSHLFDQLRHCKRCRQDLPAEILHEKAAWRDYAWKQYVALYDEYFAKPVREIFPECLVTNWHVVFSSESDPVRYFVRNTNLPELKPAHFSATNPIAYASDAVWHELWDPSKKATQISVDAFYREQIIQQVATDKRNRDAGQADDVRSIPWVARVCRIADSDQPAVPIMSRSRYRDALCELWELDVHSMQVFNPMHEKYEELALLELQDAVAAYDKMLRKQP